MAEENENQESGQGISDGSRPSGITFADIVVIIRKHIATAAICFAVIVTSPNPTIVNTLPKMVATLVSELSKVTGNPAEATPFKVTVPVKLFKDGIVLNTVIVCVNCVIVASAITGCVKV